MRDSVLSLLPFVVAWLILSVAAAKVSVAQEGMNEWQTVTHFALIRPEADPASDENPLSPGASWLRRPKRPAETGGPATNLKKNTLKRTPQKSETRVIPLRRDRPKSETDPPKTRRRQLGW